MAVSSSGIADLADGGTNVGVGSTTAEVTAHPHGDLRVARGMPFFEQSDRGHDLTRGAVAALEGIMGKEGVLHGMQLRTLCQSFHVHHPMSFAVDSKRPPRHNTPPSIPDRP